MSETVIVQVALNTQLIAGALTSTTLSGCASAPPGSNASRERNHASHRALPALPNEASVDLT